MKNWLLAVLILVGIAIFVTACGSTPVAADVSESQHEVGDDHEPEEHSHEADEHHDEDTGHSHDSEQSMAAMHHVPEEAAAVPNPISATEASIETGGSLFAANCATCHGESGLGDGPAAASLDHQPANLTEDHVQELSDGALFYIITNGRPDTPMPAWEDLLDAEQRWNIVNFLRTLPK